MELNRFISEPPKPVITEPTTITREMAASQPIKNVKWCHTDEKLAYTGDYYKVATGAHGEVYLGAMNKNKEFIIIPVKK